MTSESEPDDLDAVFREIRACTSKSELLDVSARVVKQLYPNIDLHTVRDHLLEMLAVVDPPLRRIDAIGIYIAFLFQSKLWRYLPRNKPIDKQLLGALHGTAVMFVDLALPEAWSLVEPEVRVERGSDTPSERELLHRAYASWLNQVFLKCLSGEQRAREAGLDVERAKKLSWMWAVILGTSDLEIDRKALERSAITALYEPTDRSADLGIGTASSVLQMINARSADLSHFFVGRDRKIRVNTQGVRDQSVKYFGIKRDRAEEIKRKAWKESPADAEAKEIENAKRAGLSIGEGKHLRDIRDDLDSKIDAIPALESLAASADPSVARALGRELAAIVLGTASAAVIHQTRASIDRYLQLAAGASDDALKAALAYEMFGGHFTRRELAQRFGVSEARIVRSATAASKAVASRGENVA